MVLNVFSQIVGFIGSLCLLLFGMNMLSNGIQKGAGSGLQKLLGKITGNRFYAVLTGIGVTAIIQSSGATTVMVDSFVNAEILTLEQAIGVIFGANIGTTVDAVMSSFGASVNARRTELVHFAFNVTGTLLALLIFNPFLNLIDFIVPLKPAENITTHIAMLHTIFNFCATLIFLPFVKQIAILTRKIIPDTQAEQDQHYHFPAILPHTRISADLYSFQIKKEITKMSAKIMEMFDSVSNSFINPKNADSENERVKKLENYIDEMNDSITYFLQKCARQPNANLDDRIYFSTLIHIIDILENLSDETCSLMHTVKKYVGGEEFKTNSKRTKEIADYIEIVRIFYEQVCLYFTIGFSEDKQIIGEAADAVEEKIDETKKNLKKASRKRIEAGANVKEELQYIDIVRKVERAGDCVYALLQGL